MREFARSVNLLLNPWTLPSLGILLVFSSFQGAFPFSNAYLFQLLGVIFIFSGVLPIVSVFTLFSSHIIKDYRLKISQDRLIAMLITSVYYAILTYLIISKIGTLILISSIIIGFALSSSLVTIISAFYKICPTSASLGGVLGILSAVYILFEEYNFILPITVGILATGSLLSIRLYLNKQTLNETLIGLCIGFLSCFLIILNLG